MPKFDITLTGYVGSETFYPDDVRRVSEETEEPLAIHICSPGGSLADGFEIHNIIRDHEAGASVHYSGLCASAATIAGLGARKITMDPAGFYMIHKASMQFLQWANLNADDCRSLAESLSSQAEELDKFDAAIARLYAARCKRPVAEMLQQMRTGNWLSAQEALEWGFVDEITEKPEGIAVKVEDSVSLDALRELHAFGCSLPPVAVAAKAGELPLGTLSDQAALLQNIKDLLNNSTMNTNEQNPQTAPEAVPATSEQTAQNEAPEAGHNTETPGNKTDAELLAEAQARIEALEAENAELKKKPGAKTQNVVNQQAPQTPTNAAAKYVAVAGRARDLFNKFK
ncbi:MAG: hypothetical protein HDS67_02320 [Bacteroidales bacterium]|nr:hypothetical protein [Bacteroidales bacterium]